MASERLFIDTWGWLVLANRRDPAFRRALEIRAHHAEASVTTDYVLDECMTRLFSRVPFTQACKFMEGLFEASGKNLLDIEHVTPERFSVAWRLRLRYHDKPRISFTDFTSFVVMQELRINHVLTEDDHFEQVGMGFMRLQ